MLLDDERPAEPSTAVVLASGVLLGGLLWAIA
jgi:hypothetical protein